LSRFSEIKPHEMKVMRRNRRETNAITRTAGHMLQWSVIEPSIDQWAQIIQLLISLLPSSSGFFLSVSIYSPQRSILKHS